MISALKILARNKRLLMLSIVLGVVSLALAQPVWRTWQDHREISRLADKMTFVSRSPIAAGVFALENESRRALNTQLRATLNQLTLVLIICFAAGWFALFKSQVFRTYPPSIPRRARRGRRTRVPF